MALIDIILLRKLHKKGNKKDPLPDEEGGIYFVSPQGLKTNYIQQNGGSDTYFAPAPVIQTELNNGAEFCLASSNCVTVVKKLTEGKFGQIYEIKKQGVKYTMKVIPLTNEENEKGFKEVYSEIMSAQKSAEREQSIMKIFDFAMVENNGQLGTTENLGCVIMEYIEGVNLSDYLKNNLDPKKFLDLVKCILEAFHAFHSVYGRIHGDIKPQNIMVVTNGHKPCSIVDFDISYKFQTQDTLRYQGYVRFMPSAYVQKLINGEALTPAEQIHQDNYAIVVTLTEMLFGKGWTEKQINDVLSDKKVFEQKCDEGNKVQIDKKSKGYPIFIDALFNLMSGLLKMDGIRQNPNTNTFKTMLKEISGKFNQDLNQFKRRMKLKRRKFRKY